MGTSHQEHPLLTQLGNEEITTSGVRTKQDLETQQPNLYLLDLTRVEPFWLDLRQTTWIEYCQIPL